MAVKRTDIFKCHCRSNGREPCLPSFDGKLIDTTTSCYVAPDHAAGSEAHNVLPALCAVNR